MALQRGLEVAMSESPRSRYTGEQGLLRKSGEKEAQIASSAGNYVPRELLPNKASQHSCTLGLAAAFLQLVYQENGILFSSKKK